MGLSHDCLLLGSEEVTGTLKHFFLLETLEGQSIGSMMVIIMGYKDLVCFW